MTMRRLVAILFASFILMPVGQAYADCSNPSGPEGNVVYNKDFKVMQFCNGTQWISMAGTGSTGSTTPTTPIFEAGAGYLVLSSADYTGSLGGRSGANALCLTDLTNNDWKGKSTASSAGILNASHVKAWLCDATCDNLSSSIPYYFARSGSTTAGGATITADSNGLIGYSGSNPYGDPPDGNQWSALNYFNGSYNYWTNRGTTYNFAQTTPDQWNADYYCQNWSSGSASYVAPYGMSTATNNNRFRSGTAGCQASNRLICVVHP